MKRTHDETKEQEVEKVPDASPDEEMPMEEWDYIRQLQEEEEEEISKRDSPPSSDPMASQVKMFNLTEESQRKAESDAIMLSKPKQQQQADGQAVSALAAAIVPDKTPEQAASDHAVESLERLWGTFFPRWPDPTIPNPDPSMSCMKSIEEVVRIFSLEEEHLADQKKLEAKVGAVIEEVISALSEAHQTRLISNDQVAAKKFRLILDKANASKFIIQAISRFKESHAGNTQPQPGNLGLWRFLDVNMEQKPNILQQIVIQVLSEAAQYGYRRYKGSFYEPIRNSKNQMTCAWQCVVSIEDFLWQHTKDTTGEDGMWFNLSRTPKIVKTAAEYLKNSLEDQVPHLKPDRHTFSFDNGAYLADKEIFLPYDAIEFKSSQNSFPVACKHFDMQFDPEWTKRDDYMTIPTPAFDKICSAQHLSPTMVRWFLTMIGRCIYGNRELDDWQVVLYIKGLAGTGKSNVLNYVVAQFYDVAQVGVISNNIEEKFGLATLADKFVVMLDDIRENFKLDQSDFQNMISGLQVSCPVKNGDPKVLRWTASLIGSGNEIPRYRDNGGSIGRRMFIIPFKHFVEVQDCSLSEKLMAELAAMICKTNMAYRNTLRKIGKDDFWKSVPPEVIEEKRQVTSSSNYLMNFLDSKAFVYGPEHKIPLRIFKQKMLDHAAKNSFRQTKWIRDFYEGPFAMHKIRIEILQRSPQRQYHGKPVSDIEWVVGCDIPEESALPISAMVQRNPPDANPK